MISARTVNYAMPPAGHYWKWSSGHDAIEWADGTTLALWPEVHTLLDHLAANGGLPPLGAVLLLLASCRDDQDKSVSKVRRLLAGGATRDLPPDVISRLEQGLEAIQQLPRESRTSLGAKCQLAQAIFEKTSFSLSLENSAAILNEISVSPAAITQSGIVPRHSADERVHLDLRGLHGAFKRFARLDSARLESRLRTGLDDSALSPPELPSPAEDTIEPRLLLDHLISSGGESGAAAAVAKRAIAMMNFPGRFGTPRDLPVGGIADITNRGTVDRLLPGELAWDDLVLAARLVHNEALYFRREIPPEHVAVSHTVLLDRGLRLWGTARVFSLGVALGLWHHPSLHGPGETFECVAADRDGFSYLDLSNFAGVRAALEVLIPAASPDTFLTSWWDAARIVDDPAIPDVSFVTVKEHLDDAETRRLLGEIAGWIHERAGRFRVIATDRLGNLEMQAWSPGGNHTLFRGAVDLDEILNPPSPAPAPKLTTLTPLRAQPSVLLEQLPIYAEEPLPFLFPVIPQASAYFSNEVLAGNQEGGTGVSLDHRLMRWPKSGWGAMEEVPGKLPGRQHWIGHGGGGELIVIASAEQAGGNVRVFAVRDRKLQEIEIEASRHSFPRHAAVSGGAVVLAYADRAEALSLKSGRRVAEDTIAKLPASPVVDFDGETIRVFDSGKKAGLGPDGWSLRDTSWPRLLSPDQISIHDGWLLVMCGDTAYRFNPFKISWEQLKPGPARFAAFIVSDHSPASGVNLRVASVGHLTAWHDSRGLLHLRQSGSHLAARNDSRGPLHVRQAGGVPDQTWSILLATPGASIWNPELGTFSHDQRLLAPSNSPLPPTPIEQFKSFLTSATAIRS